MDSEKNKKILIAVVVVCLAAAAFVALRNLKSESGPPGGDTGIAYKCTKCGHSQMIKGETAVNQARQEGKIVSFGPPVLNCPKCKTVSSLVFSQKCLECGCIFLIGEAKDPQSPLKCPKCGKTPLPPSAL